MAILQTKGLSIDFAGLKVLSDINLEVERGERHAIIGPNGAGKTTLFNLIDGSLAPSKGQIFFRGMDITKYKPFRRSRLGIGRSFQITKTFENMTAFQNVRLGILSKLGLRYNLLGNVDKMTRVTRETEQDLNSIELKEQREVPARELSHGQQRALEVSLAMTTEPELVMLDEPTAGLSSELTRHAIKLIRRLTENNTVIIIEHDMDVVFSLADRITVLHHGEILACGAPNEIKNNREVKDAFLGDLLE